MAYRASIKNPFGRGALINLLRQFGKVSCAERMNSASLWHSQVLCICRVNWTLSAKEVMGVSYFSVFVRGVATGQRNSR